MSNFVLSKKYRLLSAALISDVAHHLAAACPSDSVEEGSGEDDVGSCGGYLFGGGGGKTGSPIDFKAFFKPPVGGGSVGFFFDCFFYGLFYCHCFFLLLVGIDLLGRLLRLLLFRFLFRLPLDLL